MASVNYYLKRSKEKDGVIRKDPVRIYLKFTIDRAHRFDLHTGEFIIPKYWDADKQCAKAQMPNHVGLNQILSRLEDQIIQLHRDNKGVDFKTFQDMCRNMVKHGTSSAPVEKKSLTVVLDLFLSQYEREKDSKTVAKYRALKSKLLQFNPKLCIEGLDLNFYDRFKTFLFTLLDNHGKPVGLLDDTVYKYITNLKTFLSWAQKRGFEVSDSYKSWEIIKRKHQPITLTMAELEKLESFEITEAAIMEFNQWEPTKQNLRTANRWKEGLTIARDYLAFECRTGQRISDIRRFSQSQYEDFKWTFQPRKGNRLSSKKVTVHFKGYCAPALFILARNNFQMPEVSEPKLNVNIKRLCRLAGIDSEVTTFRWAQNKQIRITGPKYEFISTHTGRRTFVTIALQFMPPRIVMELTGIESFATLNHYMGASDHDTVAKYLESVETKTLMRKAE